MTDASNFGMTMNHSTLIAFGSAVALALASGAAVSQPAKAEVTGSAQNLSGTCPSLSFTISGIRIVTNAQTDFDDGACDNIQNASRLDVEGNLQADGTLVASEVDVD